MIKKRIGKTIKLIYNLTTNGNPVSLENRDFTIFIHEVHHPDEKIKLPVVIEGNKLTAIYEGKDLYRLGVYASEIYENFRKNNQTVTDQVAFELVPNSSYEN